MIRAFGDYTYIAGNHGKRGSLWQGPDHLLVVEGRGFWLAFREHYRRIDYKHIQALSLVKTSRWIWLNALFIILMGIFGIAMLNSFDAEIWVAFAIVCPLLLCGTLLVINWNRGPTCICTLQTAVQNLRLPQLRRMNVAVKVFSELEALAKQHQGEFLPVEVAAAAAASSPPDSPLAEAISPPSVPMVGEKPFWKGSRWVLWAGITLAMLGAVIAIKLFVPSALFFYLGVMGAVVAFLLVIIALVNAMRFRAPAGLVPSLWAGLILQCLGGIAAYIALIGMHMRHTSEDRYASDQFDVYIENLARLTMNDLGTGAWVLIGYGLLFVLLGLFIAVCGITESKASAEGAGAPPAVPPPLPPGSAAKG